MIYHQTLSANPVRDVPTMLNYNTHIGKQSMFNTPPVFAIYVSMLTLRWVKAQGGVVALEQKNREKAALLYNAIEKSSLFHCPIAQEDRSDMNVVFVPHNADHTAPFIAAASEAGCEGVKGHRSVGGCRASIYNAMPKEGIETLVRVIESYTQANG